MDSDTIFTIGHSTRPLDGFIDLLRQNEVEAVMDVRTIPRSGHNPQFNGQTLAAALAAHGVGYLHMPELGGLRHPRADSLNKAWKNPGFRGFADYMQTPEFRQALDKIISMAHRTKVTLMCAEAVPWRCHRLLIADALTVAGYKVEHIIGKGRRLPHTLTSSAHIDGDRLTYPSTGGQNEGNLPG